ncbi:MAG: tetratricopeptide repeat protein [Acidobacteriaceae bacterium]
MPVVSFPAFGHAQSVCPWPNNATAAGALDGPVRLSVDKRSPEDVVCTFSSGNSSPSYVLKIAKQRSEGERTRLHARRGSCYATSRRLFRMSSVFAPIAGLFCLCVAPVLHGQSTAQPADGPSMQQHYDDAVRLQSSGDLAQADGQYRLFLSEALDRIASDRAHAGEYAKAVPLFDEALQMSPHDLTLESDYAEALLVSGHLQKAKQMALEAVQAYPKSAKAHALLGRVLLRRNENQPAKSEFEKAVALDPNFENGYALATADLALADQKDAASIFKEMQTAFGDTAGLHMQFGLAYGNADDPEPAIQEFKKTIAEDDRYPGAHYSLGASYLLRSGETDFAQAEAEFHKELTFHPDDYLSYSQLGYIAMTLHRLPEAIADLTHATELDPQDPDNFLLLGQIYADMGKSADAEAALRSAIAVTVDPSRNHYQIRGAHYQLGRLLIRGGRTAEGKKEMQTSEELLLQNKLLDKANITGKPLATPGFSHTPAAPVDEKMAEQVNAFEKQIAPAIADSYNNLGVIAAMGKNYSGAAEDFELAGRWDPSMEGLNNNWGRAAFAAHLYPQAVGPLQRHLQAHPEDASARSTLGVTQYMLHDYVGALQTLRPIRAHVGSVPALALVYADILVHTGNVSGGIDGLKALEQSNPTSALVHRALAEAYRQNHQPQDAERESEIYQTLQSRPSSANPPAKPD